MDPTTIERIFAEHHKPGWGSINPDEVSYFDFLIRKHSPSTFLEVGMASGISGGILARILEENGGRHLTTIDYDNTFFGDPSKENGFLIDQIYPGGDVTVDKRPFTIAADLPEVDRTYEMAFIDANHQHPWPTLDTLCVTPYLTGPKVLIHHDLDLFRKQDVLYGVGPKYLYDQLPPEHREMSTANNGNVFSCSMDFDTDRLETLAADALLLPWTLRTPLQPKLLSKLRAALKNHYSESLLTTFELSLRRYNQVDRLRTFV